MNTKNDKSRQFPRFMITVFAALAAASVMAADSPLADNWDVDESSTPASVTVTQDGARAVTIEFPIPNPLNGDLKCDLLIGGADPSSLFNGDLSEYSGIQFRYMGDIAFSGQIELYIYQRFPVFHRLWTHEKIGTLGVPLEWTVRKIPFDVDQGWTRAGYAADTLVAWNSDLSDVHALFLRIVPTGTTQAQTFSISDLQLIGKGDGAISEPATLSPLQAYFGVNSAEELTADMLRLDSDGDGMSDYHELLAGLNPYDASSVLAAQVAKTTMSNTVSWQGVLGGRYGVMRSNNLLEGFKLIAADRICGFTGELMTFEDSAPVEGEPNYYKIVKY